MSLNIKSCTVQTSYEWQIYIEWGQIIYRQHATCVTQVHMPVTPSSSMNAYGRNAYISNTTSWVPITAGKPKTISYPVT